MLRLTKWLMKRPIILFPGVVVGENTRSKVADVELAFADIRHATALASRIQEGVLWYSLGQISLLKNEPGQAVDAYTHAMSSHQTRDMASIALGNIMHKDHKYASAVAAWSVTTKAGISLCRLGDSFRTYGNWENAIESYKLAARIAKETEYKVQAYVNISKIYWTRLWQLDEALRYIDLALLMNPSDDSTRIQKIQILIDRHSYQLAFDELQNLLSKNPRDPDALNLLGTCYYHTGDLRRAEAAARQSLRIRETSAWSHYTLAQVLQESGNHAEACRHYCRILELQPNFVMADQIKRLSTCRCN
jgi:tetratricopeptide (TPR) repeat protein